MGAGAVVLGALKIVGQWALKNPNLALGAVDAIAKIQAEKKSMSNEEHLQIVDEKLNQVGAATLELDQKIDTEIALVYKQLRTLKIMTSIIGALLGIAVVAIILLAILK